MLCWPKIVPDPALLTLNSQLSTLAMSQPSTIHLLNRLLGIVSRSFLQYLKFSQPYVPPGRKEVLEVLDTMVTDQNSMADRISQMVMDQQELARTGEFPMEFTDLHDLEIDHLLLCRPLVL